jgi:hypothetical protein
MGIRPGDRVHGVEPHPKPGLEQQANLSEIKQLLHQISVIRHCINNVYPHIADQRRTRLIKVNVGRIQNPITLNVLGRHVNGFSHFFRRRSAVGGVELDAEIFIRPTGIVAGRQDDSASGVVLANQMRRGGRGQNAARADYRTGTAIGAAIRRMI